MILIHFLWVQRVWPLSWTVNSVFEGCILSELSWELPNRLMSRCIPTSFWIFGNFCIFGSKPKELRKPCILLRLRHTIKSVTPNFCCFFCFKNFEVQRGSSIHPEVRDDSFWFRCVFFGPTTSQVLTMVHDTRIEVQARRTVATWAQQAMRWAGGKRCWWNMPLKWYTGAK